MKITANRKEDILKRKAEYEADVAKRQEQHEAEEERYRDAQRAVTEPVKKEVEDIFSKYPLLHARVRVDPYGKWDTKGMSIRIDVNEDSKFEDDTALAWSYEVYLDNNGEPIRETNSWSGMKAVNADQLANLEQTLSVLKELLNIDWKALLDRALPEYQDYVHTRNPRYDSDKPDFDKELREAEMDDIIGQRKLIEVKAFPSSWYYPSYKMRNPPNVFVAIVKDSGTQYTIKEVSSNTMQRGMDDVKRVFDENSAHRVKKDQIIPVMPINIVDIPE